MIIKIVYMEDTLKYFHEIFGNNPNEISAKLVKGIPKISSQGTKYLLIEEPIELPFNNIA